MTTGGMSHMPAGARILALLISFLAATMIQGFTVTRGVEKVPLFGGGLYREPW